MNENYKLLCGDALEKLKELPDECVDCVMTSPPYWALRDYGVDNQIGLESDFNDYINRLCDIFDEVKRVLKPTGTCWVNIGDTYGGGGSSNNKGFNDRYRGIEHSQKETEKQNMGRIKPLMKSNKSLCQIPSRFAIEMTNRGWILRNEIIWHKPNCMPSSVKDRFTVDFEKIFFFVKQKKYYFETQYEELKIKNVKGIKFGGNKGCPDNPTYSGNEYNSSKLIGRNKRTVWTITTKPYKEAHFAVFPEDLCETPIKAGCVEGGIVLDPFCGSGTAGAVALKLNRKFIGIDLNAEYLKLAEKRIKEAIPRQQKLEGIE